MSYIPLTPEVILACLVVVFCAMMVGFIIGRIT